MELPCDSAVPTLGISPREVKIYSHTKTYSQVFIAAIFGIGKSRKIPKSSMSDWMNRLWYIHPVEHNSAMKRNDLLIHSTTWMNFKDIPLIERRESQSMTCYMLICSMFLKRQKCRDREQLGGCQGLWVG